MTKVSVIVAAYNVEKYIEDTLHSLVNQTMEDAEFIIVDDCSTDKTGEIIKSYAETDNRIKYIKLEENKGTMLVCKIGCDAACGEYIMFLDGDDTLDFKACEIAYNFAKKEKVDILQYGIDIFSDYEDDAKLKDVVAGFFSYIGDFKEKVFAFGKGGLLGNKHSQNKINFTMRNKIFRKSVVDKANSQLPDEYLIVAEDVLFSYIACFYAKSYAYIDDKLYNYRIGSGISTSQKISDKKTKALAKCCFVYNYLKDWTEKQGAIDVCISRLNIVRNQMLRNAGDAFLRKMSAKKRNFFVTEVLKYCPIDTFISTISYMVLNDKIIPIDEFAEICSQLDVFKTVKKEKKTIGTFYYRMYNGGVENVLAQLTDIWVKSGYAVVLFTDTPPQEDDYPINPKVTRVVLPKYIYGKFETFEDRITVFKEKLKKYNVDIMVYNAWMNPYFVSDALAAKSLGISFISHTHGVFCADMISIAPEAAYINTTLHRLYSLCDMVIALNTVDKAYWNALGIRCIQTVNPITFPLNTHTAPLCGKNVVMTCRLAIEKQIIDAIKIIEGVREKIPDATLTIVGSGDDKYYVDSVKNYIKENKLEDSVKMVGFKKDVVPYYQDADIMLITSKYEGFCLSLVESKLCGLPLVTYDLPNLDTVREAKGMFVVEQGDIEGAADRIIEILSDDDLKKKMGKEARESGEEILSFDIAKQWDYIFEQAIVPKEEPSQKSDISTALDILLDFTAEGIMKRGSTATVTPAHTAQLEATIKEIRSSTSYRLGWFLTTIPRKIKDFIKGQKYVE